MLWKILALLLMGVGTFRIILTKALTDRFKEKEVGVFYQYLGAFLFALTYGLLRGQIELGFSFFLAGSAAFLFAFVNYLQWRTYAISLSKTSLLLPLAVPLSILLADWFFAESAEWTIKIVLGIVCSFAAVAIFIWSRVRKSKEETMLNKRFYFFISLIIVLVAFGPLLTRFLANPQIGGNLAISSSSFLIGWYSGGLIGAFLILLIAFYKKGKSIITGIRGLSYLFTLGFLLFISQLLNYFIYNKQALVSMLEPLKVLAIYLFPVLAGLFIFKERKGLSKIEWFAFVLGIVGACFLFL